MKVEKRYELLRKFKNDKLIKALKRTAKIAFFTGAEYPHCYDIEKLIVSRLIHLDEGGK